LKVHMVDHAIVDLENGIQYKELKANHNVSRFIKKSIV
jgi:hypothetical protein